jgi:hypothetical protein
MKTPAEELTKKHQALTHTENIKVMSHVQRENADWFLNTLMLENVSVPFKYKRKKRYKTLKDHSVNITYYADSELVAGFEIEVMNVVRVKIA